MTFDMPHEEPPDKEEYEKCETLEHLKRSCERLPELLELNSPSSTVIHEIEILLTCALSCVRQLMDDECHHRLSWWRKQKEVQEK